MDFNIPQWIGESRKNTQILSRLPRAGGELGDRIPGLQPQHQNRSPYSTSEDAPPHDSLIQRETIQVQTAIYIIGQQSESTVGNSPVCITQDCAITED